MTYQLVQRRPGQAIPVPAIVHWRVNHYAAILEEKQGRYHIQDPIFGEDLWVTEDAIDSEASGYFLVAGQTLQPGWHNVQAVEVAGLYGMGSTGTIQASATTPQDDKVKPSTCSHGLCGYNFTEMTVSLNLTDTPVGYAPPIGPPVFTTLTYNQREAGQPGNFGFFNVSPKWSLNWLSYIEDNPAAIQAGVRRIVAGGGYVDYSGYDSTTGQFAPEARDGSVLVMIERSPITYERRLANGGKEIYSHSSGAVTNGRRVFLTRITDAQGNSLDLQYDAQMRLTSIQDATRRNTYFEYGLSHQPLLVTKIIDPFGRSASLDYDGKGRLTSITDVLGLISTFHYIDDASPLINSMTTPYGTTTFAFGEDGTSRWLSATDPLGYKEHLEYRHAAPGISSMEPADAVPDFMSVFNNYLHYRNTFYWDKHAYQLGAGDYSKARIKHWTHSSKDTNVTSAPLESIKYPLENRIWFRYPGQNKSSADEASYSGSLNQPSQIGRVLDDGSTQLTTYEYNALGRITHVTDAKNRNTRFEYAPNQIDLIRVSQQTGYTGTLPVAASNGLNTERLTTKRPVTRLKTGQSMLVFPIYSTIAEFTPYDYRHLPGNYVDAAGHYFCMAYNALGQVLAIKEAPFQNMSFLYDNLGYLTAIYNTKNQLVETLQYEADGHHVASRTDSEGYTLGYHYDNLDRITQMDYPDGTHQTLIWDKLDLAAFIDRQGRKTQFVYDKERRLKEVIDQSGRKTRYNYYPNGTLKSLVDAADQETVWDRDLQNRVVAKRYADGRKITYQYEQTTSRLKRITDSLGQSKQLSYDRDDALIQIDYINTVNETPSVSLSYDRWFPRLVRMIDGIGISEYSYVESGQFGALKLQYIDGPYAKDTQTYQYDAYSRPIKHLIHNISETFEYDKVGRLDNHKSPLGDFQYAYLGASQQPTSLQRANSSLGTLWQYAGNDQDRRLQALTHSGATRSYQYDSTPGGPITRQTETAVEGSAWSPKTWHYTYDTADRLTEGWADDGSRYAYSPDDGDNLLTIATPAGTRQIAVNELNQATDIDGVAQRYDANGNLVDDGIRRYQWDADNRLIRIEFKARPQDLIRFRYDGLGRRTVTLSKIGGKTTESRHIWCGEQLCQTRTAATDSYWKLTKPGGFLRVCQGCAMERNQR